MFIDGLIGLNKVEYNNKHYTLPILCPQDGISFQPQFDPNIIIPTQSPIIQTMNQVWDLQNFATPRQPVSAGFISESARAFMFNSLVVVPRILDMPIKLSGSLEYRIPRIARQFMPAIQQIANYQLAANPDGNIDELCYITIDGGWVEPGNLQREAACHVDGFQGARWIPKRKVNHTYTFSNVLPTFYYVQPFDFSQLDERKHNFFFEMNDQVQDSDSAFAWQPQPFEIVLMDGYTVHRGSEATKRVFRYFVRLSYEVRIFDRMGNAHNPLFDYNWEMVERDIEQLNLVRFRTNGDPANGCFPWQRPDGTPHTDRRIKTKPNLRLPRPPK